jgi:hypothetical protein
MGWKRSERGLESAYRRTLFASGLWGCTVEKRPWTRIAAAVLLAAVSCLWSYSLGWQRGCIASDVAFNRRLADLTRVVFEKAVFSNEAPEEDARANADE